MRTRGSKPKSRCSSQSSPLKKTSSRVWRKQDSSFPNPRQPEKLFKNSYFKQSTNKRFKGRANSKPSEKLMKKMKNFKSKSKKWRMRTRDSCKSRLSKYKVGLLIEFL